MSMLSFSQVPLNPSQQFQMLQTLKQRGIITAEQAQNPGSIQVIRSTSEDGFPSYTIGKSDGQAYMELTDLGKGKFSTFQYDHANHSARAVLSGSVNAQGKLPGKDGESIGGKAAGEVNLLDGKATGTASGNLGDSKVEKTGSIDLTNGDITSGKGGSYDGAIKDGDLIKGTGKKDPILGVEGNLKGGYVGETDRASFGVLQPSGSLTEVQVQREIGLIEGEVGARLKIGDAKKLIENLEKGELKKAAEIAKGGGGASGQVCVVKATDTISHRNAPEIDGNGNATINSFKGEANVCVGGGLELKFGNGKLSGKLGPLGTGVATETETGKVTPEQRDFIEANEQGGLSDAGDFLGSMKDLTLEGGGNALSAMGIDKAWDWAKNKASDAWDWTKDKASDAWDSTFGDDPPPNDASPTPGALGIQPMASMGSWGGGESISGMETEADDLSQEADGHADRAESAARQAQAAARRAAAVAARIRAMISRRYG